MTKRNMWSYDETLEMLNIMLRQESLKAMNGRPFRKDKAFRLVYEEMVHRGYSTKDPKQIEYRWKNLKRQYVDLQKEPTLVDTNPFPYYDEIDVLMKGKPPAASQTTKLCELVISKVERSSTTEAEEVLLETEMEPIEQVECEIGTPIASEEVVQETVVKSSPQPQTSQPVPKRLKRSRRRQGELPKAFLPPYKTATEEEVFRNQKKLIDYQFGLYSKAQEESDQKFLAMSRQMLEECNDKFQVFLAKLAPGN
uniref:Myb/SANT-like DNA-binding domain-containing protein n=1 Tax=Anopheles merus TaxID=30066 RepID=A0A182VJX0_ANOME